MTNLTSGGSKYSEMSEETKLRISESVQKYWTVERRKSWSDRMKSVMSNPEVREKCATKRGMQMSDESKQKLSKAKTGVALSDSHKKAVSAGMLGKSPSIDARKKLSESIKGTNKPSRYQGWELLSPDGEIITVECLKTFCNEHNLSIPGFHKSVKSGKIITRGKSTGWKVIRKIPK